MRNPGGSAGGSIGRGYPDPKPIELIHLGDEAARQAWAFRRIPSERVALAQVEFEQAVGVCRGAENRASGLMLPKQDQAVVLQVLTHGARRICRRRRQVLVR
jgi:hypothetical protein